MQANAMVVDPGIGHFSKPGSAQGYRMLEAPLRSRREDSGVGQIYRALAEHQQRESWELRDLLTDLHRWVPIISRWTKVL
jgi:hypothetical protein